MFDNDLALLAYLMRRAGFGATREELEVYATQSYAAVVEDLGPGHLPRRRHRHGHGEGRAKAVVADLVSQRAAKNARTSSISRVRRIGGRLRHSNFP